MKKPIIARFKFHKTVKSELYKAKKHLKSFVLQMLFILMKTVTTQRRKLFAKVRQFTKDNHCDRAWTAGKIFIKKSQQDQPKKILAEEDLRNISYCLCLVPQLSPFFMLIFSPIPESNQNMYLYSPSSLSPCSLFLFWNSHQLAEVWEGLVGRRFIFP